jgi:hypothetical protein
MLIRNPVSKDTFAVLLKRLEITRFGAGKKKPRRIRSFLVVTLRNEGSEEEEVSGNDLISD